MPGEGREPIHYAALDGDTDLIRRLIGEGAHPSPVDKQGWAPLHFAAQERQEAATRALLEAGADPNVRNDHGNPPLFVAVMNCRGDGDVITLL